MLGFGEVSEQIRRFTVQVETEGRQRGSGSGVIWSTDGLIVTNAHVASAPEARITLWDGSSFAGALTARTLARDLSAFQIPARGLPFAVAGDSDALRAGELVIAVGNPLGFIGALATGVVHGLGPVRGLGRQSWVQADVRLAPGNSGGPLADARGRVIGINAMVAGGLALAVPSNAVADFLRDGATDVELGVVAQPVPMIERRSAAVGLLLLEIAPGSPAATASLAAGDVLVKANGRFFRSLTDFREILQHGEGDHDGELLELQFLRGLRAASGREPSRGALAADRLNLRKVTVRLPRRKPGRDPQGAPGTGVSKKAVGAAA